MMSTAHGVSVSAHAYAHRTALQAAGDVDAPLLLLLYEDLVAAPSVYEQQFYTHLGIAPTEALLTAINKRHKVVDRNRGPRVRTKPGRARQPGVRASNASNEWVASESNHNAGVCAREGVRCGSLERLLGTEYPCLLKQMSAPSDVAWTMPMLPDGRVDVRGNCHPIRAATQVYTHGQLDATQRRRLAELYV